MLSANYQTEKIEAGCDEAGRGCLAGPVVAAAVVLPRDFSDPIINDSKLLTKKERTELKEEILRHAVAHGIGVVDNTEIDRINILKASFRAMHMALDQLKVMPGFILVDGNRFEPYKGLDYTCIIKGDQKYLSIAAASILAKTARDELMYQYAREFPDYHWDTNVGYPTQAHREAIRRYGLTKYHRRTFRLLPDQLTIF